MPAITRFTVAAVDGMRRANSVCEMPFNSSQVSSLMPNTYAGGKSPSIPALHPALWTVSQAQRTLGFMSKGSKKRKIFGPWFLKEWRTEASLTLEQLADSIGTTSASISRLENRKQPYSQPLLEALADALNCRPGDLISRPPGYSDRLAAVLAEMDPDAQKRALAVVQALKDSEKAA